MKLSANNNSVNKIVYRDNKFKLSEYENGDVFFVYVDLEKYKDSKTIFSIYFSHIYCELLYDFCKALNMPYLFTISPVKHDLNNDMFLRENTKRIKNKNLLIRQSAYLQHIVKTFENNGNDIYNSKSVHSIFDYDNIKVIEIVRSVLLEYLIKSSKEGASENLKTFEKNTKRTLKLLKKRAKIIRKDCIDLTSVKNEVSQKEDEHVTIDETAAFFKVSRQTVYNWRKKGLIEAHSIEGRVYYKKNELLKLATKLK